MSRTRRQAYRDPVVSRATAARSGAPPLLRPACSHASRIAAARRAAEQPDTRTLGESLAVLDRHIEAIGPEHVAIGSDLDGFIKPTIGGIESAADLATFAERCARATRSPPRAS
jgi:microsomal dipeptidase-like Zn-dependent dipeptidase